MSTTTEKQIYWPTLLDKDPRFSNISIYLGGYYTSIDAGHYDIRNSADELFNGLKRRQIDGSASVLDKQNLIFVCHSTGGIVVRYMLVNRYEFFSKKTVGAVLIASPSYGSRWANWLGVLTSLYGHRVGEQLKEGSWSLRDLDAQFKNLINERKIPQLCGVEAYENHFVIHNKWIPNTNAIVNEESAGRYFGAPALLRNTDHFSSVKPDTFNHPAYELLVDFCQTHSDVFLAAADSDTVEEYLFFDKARISRYFSQLEERFDDSKVGVNIRRFQAHLEKKGALNKTRPSEYEFSERIFVLEDMLATKIVFPRASKDNSGPTQIAVWLSNPQSDPGRAIPYSEPDGTILYLIEEYYFDDDDDDEGSHRLHPISGYSALAHLLQTLDGVGGVMSGEASAFQARQKRSSSLEVLRQCGGIVQSTRRIRSLYKPRSYSDDEYVLINGVSRRSYGLFAYPIFISVP